MRVIISGGGTGGHIFPAIAIANALKAKHQDIDILFVGAEGRMEMDKVPRAGYKIVGLPIAGFQRKLSFKNLILPFKILASMRKAANIIKEFQPDVCVGVGGYASGPVLRAAQKKGISTVIQEQNSYAGVTNKILAKKADAICVAYDRMGRFFPEKKIVLTGNPVRADIKLKGISQSKARETFGLDPDKKTILLFGGSLGAKSLNDGLMNNFEVISKREDIQIIWQAGKNNFADYETCDTAKLAHVKCLAFLNEMNKAYAAADVVICRAGALTISELCIVGKPAILVPSPYVAEDHQTQNAKALVSQHAAIMVKDKEVQSKLLREAYHLVDNAQQCTLLQKEIKKLGRPNAVDKIINIIASVSK